MNLITMALLATTAVSGQPGSVLDRAGVEKAVLDYRRAMQRGQMVLTQNIYSNGATTPGNKRKTAIWFDGKQIRNDITYLDDKDEPLRRDVECRNCECDSCYVDYTTYKAENTPIALSIHRMLLEKTPSPDAYSVLDPRLLGMVVEASANLARSDSALDSFVNAPNRQQVTMRPDTWKGMDCQRIDYPTGIDYPNVRIWVVPAWGYSVGRIQIGADRFMRYVESNYRQFGPAKIWFPESCVYEDVEDGKSVRKEEVAVQVVSLNEPLSPDAFKLAGMDVPVGWPISGYLKGGAFSYWDGKQIVPKDPLEPPKPPPTPRNSGWLYAVSAFTLAVVAAMAIWRSFQKRKPETPPPG